MEKKLEYPSPIFIIILHMSPSVLHFNHLSTAKHLYDFWWSKLPKLFENTRNTPNFGIINTENNMIYFSEFYNSFPKEAFYLLIFRFIHKKLYQNTYLYFVPLDGILCAFGWYTLCLWMVYFEPLDGILNYLSKEKILLMDKSRNNYCKVVF